MMKFSTLEIMVMQIGVLQMLKEEIAKQQPLPPDAQVNYDEFMMHIVIPAYKYITRKRGTHYAPLTIELLLNLATTFAVEIEERLKAEDNMQ